MGIALDQDPSSQTDRFGLEVYTRESDYEDDETPDDNRASSGTPDEGSDPASSANNEELQEGMLPRDVPKRTTFYDPVAERQMTQTDAKLFYQRSQIDARAGGAGWPQQAPQESPRMVSGSYSATEYGGDSLVLEPGTGKKLLPSNLRLCLTEDSAQDMMMRRKMAQQEAVVQAIR